MGPPRAGRGHAGAAGGHLRLCARLFRHRLEPPSSRVMRQILWFLEEMVPPDPQGHFLTYLNALGETLAIALLGTLLGALFALPLGVLAARNIVALEPAACAVEGIVRRRARRRYAHLGAYLDQRRRSRPVRRRARYRDVGLRRPRQAVCGDHRIRRSARARGGCAPRAGRAGRRCASACCRRCCRSWPARYSTTSNPTPARRRSSAFVGAGGIGLHLSEQIRVLEWRQVSFLILLILISVAAIDFISSRLRAAMAGKQGPRSA